MNKMKTAVIICAGGIGKRMEAGKPKQFIELADGTPILRKTVDVFRGMSSAADVIVVTSPEGFEDDTECIVNKNIEGAGKAFVITGGSERQDSVKNALEFLESKGFEHVGTWDFDAARHLIDRIAANGWRVPREINPRDYKPEPRAKRPETESWWPM